MSLITRCTACETLFRVVPDQLRVSEGWVRCGQCGEIFDGVANLASGELPPSFPGTDLPAPALAGPTAHPDPEPGPVDADIPLEPAPEPAGVGIDSAPGPTPATHETASIPPDPPRESPETQPLSAHAASVRPSAPVRSEPDVEPEEPESAPSFMRGHSEPSRWHRPAVRASLALLATVLIVLLSAQVLRHERDRVASAAPGWRPLLAQLCAWSRCRVESLRQIESIVIDSSSFARVRGDVYQLAFSLRNTAPTDVAMPAVELSVTNSQDQALARRVLNPAEFGTSAPLIAAGADWSARVTLQVRTASPSERVAGYRLLAFYP